MLTNLEGIDKDEIECDFIHNGNEVESILEKGIAATAAGDNGAINIWKDRDGFIRCESMKLMKTTDKKIFNNINDVQLWADEWLIIIGVTH